MTLERAAAPLAPVASASGAALTGPQKAAIVLLRLGVEQAAPLLRSLERSEVSAIMAELTLLGAVDISVADAVVAEFFNLATDGHRPLPLGDASTARMLLAESLGERAAYEVLRDLDKDGNEVPFQFLHGLDAAIVAENLKDEHPQTIALILTHLTMEFAVDILTALPQDILTDVGVRVGSLDRVTSITLEAVERALRQRMAPVLQTTFAPGAGGVDTLVELLTKVDKGSEQAIYSALQAADPELAREVRARMFTFDDLVLLDDRQMQQLFRHIDANRLPLALKGVRDEVKDRVFNNLSSRARENLFDEISLLGQVRVSDVVAAQNEVLEIVRTLEASGELIINRGGGDFVS